MFIKRKTETTAVHYRYKEATKHSAQRQGSHLSAVAEYAAKLETQQIMW